MHQVKLLISESRHERKASSSVKSRRPKSHRSKSASDQAKENLDVLNEQDEDDDDDDDDDGADENTTDGLNTQRDTSTQQDSSSNAMDSTRNNLEGHTNEMPAENADANNAEGNPNPEIVKSMVSFEIIGPDTNTEKKFLENLNLEDANHLTEAEMKATVFNANRTIETLQNDLV